jgi:hypothetical protein
MRASRAFMIGPMAVFGVAGIGLIAWFALVPSDGSAFHDNMLPELIGFSLEGFFLVGLLTLLQTTRERAYRKELWMSLRGALRGFLSKLDIALLPPHAEPARTAVLEQDPMIVRRFLREMQVGRLELDDMVALKRESVEILGLARDMIPVAAQLSARHMRWWIAIVNSIRQLSQAKSREAVEQAVNLLLENINEFDNVSY